MVTGSCLGSGKRSEAMPCLISSLGSIKNLSRQLAFFLWRKRAVESIHILVIDIVALWRLVDAGDAAEVPSSRPEKRG